MGTAGSSFDWEYNPILIENLYYLPSMNTDDEIHIPFSRMRTAGLAVVSAVFVGVGIWAVFFAPDISEHRRVLWLKLIAPFCILFFGICLMGWLWKMFQSGPGFIISEKGIQDKSGNASLGLVAWEDIVEITTMGQGRQKFITIYLNDIEKYLAKANNFQRFNTFINRKYRNNTIFITTVALQTKLDTLLALLQENFEKHSRE